MPLESGRDHLGNAAQILTALLADLDSDTPSSLGETLYLIDCVASRLAQARARFYDQYDGPTRPPIASDYRADQIAARRLR